VEAAVHGPNDATYTTPALRAYVERVGAKQRNFRRYVVTEEDASGYGRVVARIKIAAGKIECDREELAPTEAERSTIEAELAAINFPKSIVASLVQAENQRKEIGAARQDWFAILNKSRDGVATCQQRVEPADDGRKFYLPWTYFSDGAWRRMEPDGKLPLWKPRQARHGPKMIHEGAKAASFVDWLVNDPEAAESRARHPWAADLGDYEHWGWIGGAARPHDTDWSELVAEGDIIIVADHDKQGEAAIAPIAWQLANVEVWALSFDDRFPSTFDLADEFPKNLWHAGRYRGPRLLDCLRPATVATREIPSTERGPKAHALRAAFVDQWVCAIKPRVYVHKRFPNRLLDEDEFNSAVRAFSHVDNTARLLKREHPAMVDGVAYEPGAGRGIVIVDGLRCINTWTPTRVARAAGPLTEERVRPWTEFLGHLLPVESERDRVERWVATLIARPDVRMKFGLLLISRAQGVGKGTLMEKVLAPLVGWHNTSVPSQKQLTESGFNSWLARRRLVLVHELYAGESKKAYYNLSSYVTDTTLTVNEKNRPEYEMRNATHYVLSSNSRLALRLVKNDRRLFVPEVTEEKRDERYWLDLNAWLVGGGLEIIHRWAHDRVESHGAFSDGATAPSSAAKEELIELSRSEGQQIVFDLGRAAMARERPTMMWDRDVRAWLASARGINDTDPRLESLLTIRDELENAGMRNVRKELANAGTKMVRGKPWVALANAAAMALADWERIKSWETAPVMVVNEDPTNEDEQQYDEDARARMAREREPQGRL
jgi:hypothetical protein